GAVGVGVAPPGPLVPCPVDRHREPARGRLGGEPLAQGQVVPGPREPLVPTRRRPPDVGDRVEQRADAGHAPSRIGTRRPPRAAAATASSYPASTCRRTPVAGSFASTRASFCAASSVPSATDTCPAWIDRPMPTPPPWCSDTQ